jgi:hypothetical protein
VSTIPGFLVSLVDDAAIFPPGNLPLPEAVAAHLKHREAAYADLVGPFVVSDIRLPDLLEVLDDASAPLSVSVVVTGGAGAIEPAVRWATRSGVLDVHALETPLRDEDDLARNAMRVLTAVEQVRGELGDAQVYVEPPRVRGEPSHGWLAALDALAGAELRLKFRTGGVDPDAHPTASELAGCIDAALDRELAFKCTAGLHHALPRGHQHGFLNVLAGTAAAFEGAGRDEVVAVLETTDLKIQTDAFESARRWFTSFGCCSVSDPLDDLVDLGLVSL